MDFLNTYFPGVLSPIQQQQQQQTEEQEETTTTAVRDEETDHSPTCVINQSSSPLSFSSPSSQTPLLSSQHPLPQSHQQQQQQQQQSSLPSTSTTKDDISNTSTTVTVPLNSNTSFSSSVILNPTNMNTDVSPLSQQYARLRRGRFHSSSSSFHNRHYSETDVTAFHTSVPTYNNEKEQNVHNHSVHFLAPLVDDIESLHIIHLTPRDLTETANNIEHNWHFNNTVVGLNVTRTVSYDDIALSPRILNTPHHRSGKNLGFRMRKTPRHGFHGTHKTKGEEEEEEEEEDDDDDDDDDNDNDNELILSKLDEKKSPSRDWMQHADANTNRQKEHNKTKDKDKDKAFNFFGIKFR